MSHIAIDFETFFSKKLKTSLRVQIAEEYCNSPFFDCYLISVCDGESTWSGHPSEFNWASLDGAVIVSHNRYFDETVWQTLFKRGLCPKPNYKAFHCTANLTSYICNRRALADAVKHLYGVAADKEYRTVTENKRWPQDFTPEEQEICKRGGRSDARWCWRLFEDFGPQWPEHERRLSNQTIEQGMRGVQIDVPLLNTYIMDTHDLLKRVEGIIPWMQEAVDDDWEEFNTKPTSTKCIAEQCRRVGIPCPPVKSHDEEGYEEWEGLYGPKHPWISCVGSWRSINKLYKTFQTAKQRIRADGTMPFALKYFGAHTGRWAGDAKINFQNFRKVPLLINENGLLETNFDRVNAYMRGDDSVTTWLRNEIDFRRLILPRPGKKMILCDLSQIEPRCLAWLSGNTGLLDMIRSGYGVYEAFARANMGFTGPKLTKEFKKTIDYAMWKVQVLGLGYGAGWKKFITICSNYGVDITANDPEWIEKTDPATGEVTKVSGLGQESQRVVKEFRDKNQQITELWKQLDYQFKCSIGSSFEMELPNGRKLRYENVRQAVRMELDEVTKKPKKKWVFTADIGGRNVITYGGKLTENLVQACAREVFGYHLLRIEDAGHRILFTSHDEAINEVDEHVTAKDIEGIMTECPPWMPGLPLGAEAKEVHHYEK